MQFRFQKPYTGFGFLVNLQLITLTIACVDARDRQQQHYTNDVSKALQNNKGYVVYTDELDMQPSYESSVNPFLSHIEQAWQMRQNPVQNHRKHLTFKLSKSKVNAFAVDEYAEASMNYPLDVDPKRPHFMDENSYADVTSEETKAFGNEEKNFKNMLDVLFSNDY